MISIRISEVVNLERVDILKNNQSDSLVNYNSFNSYPRDGVKLHMSVRFPGLLYPEFEWVLLVAIMFWGSEE